MNKLTSGYIKYYTYEHNDKILNAPIQVNQVIEPKRLSQLHCAHSFNHFIISEGGFVHLCCPTWLPTSVGNINKASLLEILQSQLVSDIQKTTSGGCFSYCDHQLCPSLAVFNATGAINAPLQATPVQPNKQIVINLAYDRSCNLMCPSCRSEELLVTEKNSPRLLIETHEQVTQNIQTLLADGYEVTVHVTGSGDPFGSPRYSKFLREISIHKNLKINLSTNGVLMTPQRLENISTMLSHVYVSVDAATESTYNIVRQGGAFKVLMNNLRLFDENVALGLYPNLQSWEVNLIVQKDNYLEMPAFIEWAKKFKTLKKSLV